MLLLQIARYVVNQINEHYFYSCNDAVANVTQNALFDFEATLNNYLKLL